MKLMPKKVNGFTLIELLVTISIIAVLSVIGIVVYKEVFKNSRDAKRQADLKLIQSALQQYYADQFYFPTITGGQGAPCSNVNGSLKIGCPLKDPTGTKTYLNTVYDDPLSTQHYSYDAQPGSPSQCDNGAAGKCVNFCLYALLEIYPNPAVTLPSYCSASRFAGYNFFVTQP